MKVEKLTEDNLEEIEQEGELPKKSVRKAEDRQLLWFFIIIGVVFCSFLIPYFYIQDSKHFEFAHEEWIIEDYAEVRFYHGRFQSISDPTVFFNTYLRTDPRKNDVETVGTFTKFKLGSVVSLDPTVYSCTGDLSGAMISLSSFLKDGIGLKNVEIGLTDEDMASQMNIQHTTCETILDRTLILVKIGEQRVVQDEENPFCYTIYANDCEDETPVDKFIIKTVDDFGILKDVAIAKAKEE